MIIPVRCFTCGKVIGPLCEEYKKRYDEYKKAIEIDPQDSVLHNSLGTSYLNLNKPQEAKGQFQDYVIQQMTCREWQQGDLFGMVRNGEQETSSRLQLGDGETEKNHSLTGDQDHALGRIIAAVDSAKTRLGFKPETSFAKGLEATFEWYRKNQKSKK